jgi:hypothetical protein
MILIGRGKLLFLCALMVIVSGCAPTSQQTQHGFALADKDELDTLQKLVTWRKNVLVDLRGQVERSGRENLLPVGWEAQLRSARERAYPAKMEKRDHLLRWRMLTNELRAVNAEIEACLDLNRYQKIGATSTNQLR